ncbi:uncharacterized protein LOC129911886 [Episyrphus balteatus]|uniref:uncharacterized protein LOC129911886 n=1 Tax=Episyrphus balteatus TaxID=286459 RepID=UPI0024852DDE|nr:uncharacterized protein LOC129911886 [Episyrphus balteatus]
MLDGWYCRSLANEQAASSQNQDEEIDPNDGESGSEESQDEGQDNFNNPVDYKTQSRYLKRKLKFLIYENEFFQDALRSSQRRLLKVSRDRSFLLDRLLQYEKPEITSSESEETESSDDEAKEAKKRKAAEGAPATGPGSGRGRKKKATQKTKTETPKNNASNQPEGHMTAEEVERHLQSRQSLAELVPERAPPTVPTEMFSNEPSLDSESNDQMIETSPSNIGEECLSVEYNN